MTQAETKERRLVQGTLEAMKDMAKEVISVEGGAEAVQAAGTVGIKFILMMVVAFMEVKMATEDMIAETCQRFSAKAIDTHRLALESLQLESRTNSRWQ